MATCEMKDICDICQSRHKTFPAVKWCPECEEKLCDECHGNHSVSKLSRNHTVVDIEHFRKFPASILAIKSFCDQHDMKYTNLCRQHDKLCCPACTSERGPHSKCTTLLLQDVIKSTKTSTILQSIEEALNHLKANLQKIINDRQTNLQQLHDQREKIKNEVSQLKEMVVNHLNVIEQKIIEELNRKTEENALKLKSEITSLEHRLEKAGTLLKQTSDVTQYGSDLQTYLGSKNIETEVAKESNSLQELVNNGSMKRLEVKIEVKKKGADIIKNIPSFGTISVVVLPFSVLLTSGNDNQAQMMLIPQQKSIDDIKVTLLSKFIISERSIQTRGCSVNSTGRMIFTNISPNRIMLLKKNGEKEKEIPTSSGPYDVVFVDDNTVAVSTEEGIKITNITTNTLEKSINTGKCQGLEFYKGSLICCVPCKGVLSVGLFSSTTTTLVQDTNTYNSGWYYCTVHNDTIYVTHAEYNTVKCYTMRGDKVWEFKDPSLISFPLGIAVDNSSNVYIASHDNHSIVVLSPDGQRCRTLLTGKDGINFPFALYCDKRKNQLLVGSYYGTALLFNL